jgi:hypothetical protein
MPLFKKAVFKAIALAFMLFFAMPGFTQDGKDTDPSNSVMQAFTQKFPHADRIKWGKTAEEKKPLVADFTVNKTRMRAFFDKNGNLVETEKEIDFKELPERVVLSIRTQYPNDRILKAFEIEKEQNQNASIYEVVLKTENEKTSLIVSKDGYFTSR